MDANELVKVYTITDPGRAEIIRGALEDAGIPCELGGEGQGGFTGILAIDLLVRSADADRAKKIIRCGVSSW